MEKWEKLPEWSRWILCWPIIIICSLLIHFIGSALAGMATTRIWISDEVASMISPIIESLFTLPILFYTIQIFVPRKQHYLVGLWCLINFFALISGAYWLFIDFTNDNGSIWYTLRDTVWPLITLPIGIHFFFKIKNQIPALD